MLDINRKKICSNNYTLFLKVFKLNKTSSNNILFLLSILMNTDVKPLEKIGTIGTFLLLRYYDQ